MIEKGKQHLSQLVLGVVALFLVSCCCGNVGQAEAKNHLPDEKGTWEHGSTRHGKLPCGSEYNIPRLTIESGVTPPETIQIGIVVTGGNCDVMLFQASESSPITFKQGEGGGVMVYLPKPTASPGTIKCTNVEGDSKYCEFDLTVNWFQRKGYPLNHRATFDSSSCSGNSYTWINPGGSSATPHRVKVRRSQDTCKVKATVSPASNSSNPNEMEFSSPEDVFDFGAWEAWTLKVECISTEGHSRCKYEVEFSTR